MIAHDVGVRYNESLKIMALSPSTWTATAPTQWFDEYRIISIIDNPIAQYLGVIDLRSYVHKGEVEYRKVKEIFEFSGALNRLVEQCNLEDYHYVLNRSSGNIKNRPILGNSHQVVSCFENKVWFREFFSDRLNFPDYEVVSLKDMQLPEAYLTVSAHLTTELVLQHPKLAGSRGTYFASNLQEFETAINELTRAEPYEERIVISTRILGVYERTIQGCVTSGEILTGPAQSQLVRQPLLVSPNPGAIQFCGGRIAKSLATEDQYARMVEGAQVIGRALQKEGYRGVFGVDFLIQGETVYVIETNPRMTGLTPLLAFLQHQVPFLLLHILELAHEKYTVTNTKPRFIDEGSFVQIYAQNDGHVSMSSGLYDKNLNRIGDGFEDGSIVPSLAGQYFIGLRVSPGEQVPCGKSLAFVYSKEQLFDDEGQLSVDVQQLLKNFRQDFTVIS